MSVMVGIRVSADVERFKQVVAGDPDRVRAIAERGRQAGAIHHQFFASAAGDEILVVDEWPSAEAFRAFFDGAPDVGAFMGEAGVTSEPHVAIWHALDTPDKF